MPKGLLAKGVFLWFYLGFSEMLLQNLFRFCCKGLLGIKGTIGYGRKLVFM
jgi:hypothetical protein